MSSHLMGGRYVNVLMFGGSWRYHQPTFNVQDIGPEAITALYNAWSGEYQRDYIDSHRGQVAVVCAIILALYVSLVAVAGESRCLSIHIAGVAKSFLSPALFYIL